MNMFGRNSEPKVTEIPATPQSVRSRFAQMLEHMDQAYMHLDRVAHLSSTLIMDVQKGLRYIDKMRTDVSEALSVEEGIKQAVEQKYIPAQYRSEVEEISHNES
jgi:hypothetical protein